MYVITCMWESGETGLGVGGLGRMVEMTLHVETLCLDWGCLLCCYYKMEQWFRYAPLGSSNQSLYLTLRGKGALAVLLRNGDDGSCKLDKD